MTCQEFEQLLPDYFEQTLDRELAASLKHHSESCSECREQIVIWEKLALLPEEQPSPMLRTRFEKVLHAFQEGRWENSRPPQQARFWPEWMTSEWLRAPLTQAAFALIFLAAGFIGGKHARVPETSSQELASLHQELTQTRQLVTLSLLQQQSASERLQGVAWSLQENRANPEVISALLHTLRYDNSVDVRLAALDALHHYDRPEVRKGLVDSLDKQQSPLVQIAMIDLLVELREGKAVQLLKQFQQRPTLNPVVRQRAEWGLNQLIRG